MSLMDTSFPDLLDDLQLTPNKSDSFPISSSTDNSWPNTNSPQVIELIEKPIQIHEFNENIGKTNNFRQVESKTKKFRNDLMKRDNAKRFKRTKSMPETSSGTAYSDDQINSDESVNIKKQILDEKIRLAELEQVRDALNIKMEEDLLETSFLKKKMDTMKLQLQNSTEKNFLNPIDMIKKVCTPRKSPAIIYPTTSYGSASCSISFGEHSESVRNRSTLKRQLNYTRLSEDENSNLNDCSTRIFDVPTVSRRKRIKKKMVRAFFGKCFECDCFKGREADSAYSSQ